MAVYAICPHCFHPTIVPRRRTGKGRHCRQCGEAYFVGESSSLEADTVRVRSLGTKRGLLIRRASDSRMSVHEIA